MKISLNWLKDFIEFDKNLSAREIAWRITEATSEIDEVIDFEKKFEKFVVGKITNLEKHPDADKLQVVQVDIGSEEVQVVCGGSNLEKNMKVAFSLPGAMVRWHGEGEPVEVKVMKIRGVESTGMICAADEIGIEKIIHHEEGEICNLSNLKDQPGTPLSKALGIDDVVLDVDNHAITHRPDLFSHYGIARECVALGIANWIKQYPEYDLKEMSGSEKMPFKVNFSDKMLAKHYHGTVVENLDSRPSPQWMKARLFACGVRSINALVDITNYVMLESGAPMHAFDKQAISGDEFLFRLSKKGEKMTTLDGEEQKLFDDIMVVENNGNIIDLVGIMGAENSEVTDETTSVYFHQGIYDPVLIRKAMIGLGQRTDAGTIYEKGPNAELSEVGIGRTLELTKELFPEAVFNTEMISVKHEVNKATEASVSLKRVEQFLGIEIPEKEIIRILSELGCDVSVHDGLIRVVVPSWRRDSLETDVDLIEEIARIYGYSNVPNLPPTLELRTPHKSMKRHFNRTIQNYLVGQGFIEEANFSFISKALLEKAGQMSEDSVIELANPVSEDFRFMRPDLLPSMLANLSRNLITSPERKWRTFEKGAVFVKKDAGVKEHTRMTILCYHSQKDQGFFDAKGIVEGVMKELGVPATLSQSEHPVASPNHILQIQVQERVIGHVFELHPLHKETFKIKGSAAVVELDMDAVHELHPQEMKYAQLNRNPSAHLDINVIVNAETYMGEIENIIKSVGPEFLKVCELRDVYEGESLGEGKKSFTFGMSYQHPERTLEEGEIQSILDALIKKLESAGGTVRR
ncbi:MAG: phenylalanine--tRNA ligase subunit beta [Candidatus Gracilibacteria bacterium]|nr:phenylalanine--tRNA ligase subunit beta [Candidatus Gracilibacteria bacterium]